MTNKQIFLLFLAFTLVAVFCATGVFAYSPDQAVDFQAGVNLPVFSSLPLDYCFARFDFSSLDLDSLLNDGQKYPLWNNIEFSVLGRSTVSDQYAYSVTFYFNNNGTYSLARNVQMALVYPDTFKPLFRTGVSNLSYIGISMNGGSTWDSLSNVSNLSPMPTVGELSYVDYGARADVYTSVVPAGWALVVRPLSDEVIDITDIEMSISNSWNFPQVSGSSSRYNGARFGLLANSAIVQDASADGISLVTWSATNANIFGRASAYSFTTTNKNASLGFSYVFTNPLYGGSYVQSDGGGFNQNTDMTVKIYYSHVGDVEFDLVALRASLSAESGVFTYHNFFDPSTGDITGSFVPDPDGGDSGTVDFGTPQQGGGNADQPPLSENTTIFGIVSTLTNTITDLFNRAGDAMHSLVQSCNSFFSSVIAFYGWLPAEWSAVLWSFFIVLTVIGVVKLFL